MCTCTCDCCHRYSDGILALVRELLKKMQFTHNAAQLEELDDETIDDDVSLWYCENFHFFIYTVEKIPCSCVKGYSVHRQ